MKPVTIRFPDDLHNAITEAAADDTRSFSGEVIAICRERLTERDYLPPARPDTTTE